MYQFLQQQQQKKKSIIKIFLFFFFCWFRSMITWFNWLNPYTHHYYMKLLLMMRKKWKNFIFIENMVEKRIGLNRIEWMSEHWFPKIQIISNCFVLVCLPIEYRSQREKVQFNFVDFEIEIEINQTTTTTMREKHYQSSLEKNEEFRFEINNKTDRLFNNEPKWKSNNVSADRKWWK